MVGRNDRWWQLAPAAVGVFALGVALVRLGWRPFSYDEGVTVESASYPLGGIWNLAQGAEAPHAAYYVLMKPWLAAFGTTEWVVRMPSAIFGALTVVATTMVGTRLFGRWAGLTAGLALATAEYFVGWSQQARSYALSAFLATAATYAFTRAIDARGARWWAVWALSSTGAAWASLFAAPVIVAHVAAFLTHRPRPSSHAAAPALAATTVCVTPIFLQITLGEKGQLDWIPPLTLDSARLMLWNWSSHDPVLIAAAAVGVVVLARRAASASERWKLVLVCTWLVLPIAVVVGLSLAVQPSGVARYLISAAPPMALLAGAGIAALPRPLALALTVMLFTVAGVGLYHHYTVV